MHPNLIWFSWRFRVSELHRIRRNCQSMCYSFMAMACAGSTCTMMKPFLSAGSENALSYPMWSPLDISMRGSNYWFMFGYETISIFTMSVVHAGIDCLFYAIFASIHYEICVLGHRVCELGHNHNAEKKTPTYDVDKYDEIIELIQIHVQIDKFDRNCQQNRDTHYRIGWLMCSMFVFCRNIQDCQVIFNTILFIQVVQTVVGLSFTSISLMHVSLPIASHSIDSHCWFNATFSFVDRSIFVCVRVDILNFMSDWIADIPLLLARK